MMAETSSVIVKTSKFIIMAKEQKAQEIDALDILRELGIEPEKRLKKLWEKVRLVKTYTAEDFKIFRVSEKYEDSVYAVVPFIDKETKEEYTKIVPFFHGELEVEDLVVDDLMNVDAEESGLGDTEFELWGVKALRDDEKSGIAEGEIHVRLYVV